MPATGPSGGSGDRGNASNLPPEGLGTGTWFISMPVLANSRMGKQAQDSRSAMLNADTQWRS